VVGLHFAADLDRVLLVGGSTRIPAVWDLVSSRMGQDPHDQLLLQIRGAVAEYERYADIGITLIMPSARLCRVGGR